MALDNLQNDINNLTAFDWGEELTRIVETNTDALVQLQEEQLYEGIDSNGSPITLEGNGYAKSTFEIKTRKGQPTDRVTWRDTGELYASLHAIVEDGTFTFESDSEQEKYDTMIKRSGEDVIGLNEDKRLQFGNNVTLPAITQIFKDKTGYLISQQ